jgi:hypothetical protein
MKPTGWLRQHPQLERVVIERRRRRAIGPAVV